MRAGISDFAFNLSAGMPLTNKVNMMGFSEQVECSLPCEDEVSLPDKMAKGVAFLSGINFARYQICLRRPAKVIYPGT